MKKLMVMAAVALAAAVSQAASITWASVGATAKTFLVDESGKQMTKDAFTATGMDFVLVALAGEDLTSYNAGELNLAYDAGMVLSTGTISASTKAAQKGSFNTSFDFVYAEGKLADNDVLAVLITDGQTMQNVTYADGTKVTDTLKIVGLTDQEDLYKGTFNFATKGNFTAQIESVPEPTSAMLLMLGLAGLALKRKQA